MAKFRLEIFDETIEGHYQFWKLFKDDICQFDEFIEKIKKDGNLCHELNSAYSIMEDFSSERQLPESKLKCINKKHKGHMKEYEVKTSNLRIYFFVNPALGDIVVYGGKKSTQKKDISKFRNIKNQYLLS